MIHKYINYLIFMIAITSMTTSSAIANNADRRFDEDDIVGDYDCSFYDVEINGFKIDRLDARGYITDLRD